jgi:outer membrane protein assembly factor BamB
VRSRYYKRMPRTPTTICSGGIQPTLVLALLCALAQPLYAQPSSSPKDDPAHRIVALDPRWTVTFETAPAAPAGFDQQLAYVALKGGELVAIDLNGGGVAWRVSLATLFTPATGDGLVFAAGERLVTALEQRSGETQWRAPLESLLAAPLYWDTGWLIASTDAGELLALRAQDGRVLWRQALGSPIAVAPAPAGDRLFVALRDGRIAALDLATGATVWTFPLNESVTGILGLDDQLVVATRSNRVHSISLDRGRIRWTQRAGADTAGAPVADDKLIYFAALDNVLRALDRRTGNLKWKRNLASRPAGGPLRAGDVVLQPFVTTEITAFAADTGKDAFIIRAVGEIGGLPFLRESARPTAPLLVAMSREGALQGFAPRVEPPPAALGELPGIKVGR